MLEGFGNAPDLPTAQAAVGTELGCQPAIVKPYTCAKPSEKMSSGTGTYTSLT
jgi:hypothetical protein